MQKLRLQAIDNTRGIPMEHLKLKIQIDSPLIILYL